jgi:hypothetical protein
MGIHQVGAGSLKEANGDEEDHCIIVVINMMWLQIVKMSKIPISIPSILLIRFDLKCLAWHSENGQSVCPKFNTGMVSSDTSIED